VVGAAAVVFSVSSFNVLTGSAIVAAIMGFALQETLGNAFAGIAIQIEKPFRVGQWISAGDHVGRVVEVTWRATKILTKAGNLTVVPNSQMAAHAIQNYSEPAAPTRLEIDVGADYRTPPNDVRDAMLAAMRQAKYVLAAPAPEVLLADFGASAIVYKARFWIDDFSIDGRAKDAVRTAVYYEFRRRGIEIPWPIQVEYPRQEAPIDTPERRQQFKRAIAGVAVLAGLPEDAHSDLAAGSDERLFADGEVIVREGEPGASMFVVTRGRVTIAIGAERREVAVTETGGYFGEMSLLTGEPRTATVIARGDCTVLEIPADAFRTYVLGRPEVIDQLAAAAARRRAELDQARAGASQAQGSSQASLRERMLAFFGLAG
jgi:CRP-like cAMP-binding protein